MGTKSFNSNSVFSSHEDAWTSAICSFSSININILDWPIPPPVFIIGIGDKLKSGIVHDKRSPDYDDWQLDGDLLIYDKAIDKTISIICIDEFGHRNLQADIIVNPMIDSYYWNYGESDARLFCGAHREFS